MYLSLEKALYNQYHVLLKTNALHARYFALLMESTFLNRSFITHHFAAMLQKVDIPDEEILLLPLGGPGDSGKHLMYYFNH